ncbi:MAG: SDR family NAD(P)-dependent oxidoreductase [Myxococcota bacterium]
MGTRKTVVIGASGGIGSAFVELRLREGHQVFACSRTEPKSLPAGVPLVFIDIEDERSIAEAALEVGEGVNEVFVASGLLHEDARSVKPEKALRQLRFDALATTLAVNSIGPILVAKHFVPLIDKTARGVFAALSARVGSIEDNRLGGWYGYRASKAALNQLIKTASIELARTHPQLVCVGLHPGTVATELSAPFQRGVPEGKLFTAAHSARCLATVIDGLTPSDSGGTFDWAGMRIPA